MPVRDGPPQPAPPRKDMPYPAEKARGAQIVLRSRTQRIIFIAGLVGAFLLGLLLVVSA